MIILLLLSGWSIIIATVGVGFLIVSIQSGVLKGKRNIKIYRTQDPDHFWFGIVLLGILILITYYFGINLLLAAFSA